MLSFNTCFPVTPDATIDELLTIGKKWREGSPHSTITGLINSQFCLNKECYIENTTETLHFQKYTYNDYEIGGIRHTVKENDLRWATEIIGYKKDDAYWVSVKVSKESSLPQLDFHESKKPHIVKLILQKMGAGFDGNMPVGDEPIFLKDGEEDIAKMAMEDSLGCVMPTVYISIKNDGTHNIRYWEIAKRLSGMAHIIVEPSVNFSYTLKEKVNDINAYNGAIGIYWPGNMNRLFFVQRGDNSNPYKIENDVCRVVRRSLL